MKTGWGGFLFSNSQLTGGVAVLLFLSRTTLIANQSECVFVWHNFFHCMSQLNILRWGENRVYRSVSSTAATAAIVQEWICEYPLMMLRRRRRSPPKIP